MKGSLRRRVGLLAVVIVLLLAAPRVLSLLQLRMMMEIAYFSLFAVSFNFLFQYAGLLSFGHAAFFGMGAYVTAITLKHVSGMPLFLAILSAGVAGALGGGVIGFFCVRRKGSYFALLTLAFNQFLWAVAWKWREVTGGDDGIGRIVPRKPVDLGFVSLDWMNLETKYYLITAIVVLCIAFGWYLIRTPLGNTIQAIKVNEERASFLGYNVNRAKLLIFSFAAFYAAIAGSLFALFQDFVATSSIDLGMSTQVLFMAFLGGTGSYFGPILGAAIFVYFTDWISSLTEHWEFFLGVLFIVLVLYFHRGFIGLIPMKLRSLFASGKGT
jgi:branched-chain amino acid transport system permease protein